MVVADINHIENQLSPESHKLERLQGDMEALNYVLSHDVIAPMRCISLLVKEHQDKRDLSQPEIAGLLQDVLHESERSQAYIQDLVDYIQLELGHMRFKPVSLNTVLEEVKEHLAKEIEATGLTITMGQLPTILGHHATMQRVIRELVVNVLRYTPHDVLPHVSVRVQEHGLFWHICFEDNGEGIDEEFHEIVFILFQRLHAEDIPGNGVGLAYAKKAIEVHGGDMWLESSMGEGSRFYFSLPKMMEG